MDWTTILVAVIGFVGIALTQILTYVSQMKKLRNEEKERSEARSVEQQERFDKFKDEILEERTEQKNKYIEEISKVKKSVNDINLAVSDLKASVQSSQAIMELKLEYLTKELNDMKIEVREHNNFAKRLPVVEEQVRVANHRIADAEDAIKELGFKP